MAAATGAAGFLNGRLMMSLSTPTAATATTGGCSSAATTLGSHFSDHDNLKSNLLERQLVTGPSKEAHCLLGGFLGGTEFDPHGFSMKVRKIVLHLTVQDEGDIGIEFLLKLKELSLSMLPRTGLEHRKHQDILAGIVGKGIQHAGPFEPGTRGGRIRAGQIFAEGNHT